MRNVADLYGFMSDFDKENRALRPTDNTYLCDPRTFDALGQTQQGIRFEERMARLNAQHRQRRLKVMEKMNINVKKERKNQDQEVEEQLLNQELLQLEKEETELNEMRELVKNKDEAGMKRFLQLSTDDLEEYFGDSPWVTNVDKMNSLKNVFMNPNTLGKDLHDPMPPTLKCIIILKSVYKVKEKEK